MLRQIDENAGKFTEGELTVHLPQDVAIYLLNNKRAQLHEIEARAGIAIAVEIDAELNAMEMSITLPDNSEAGGVSRMEGDPAAVAEDDGNKRRRRRRGGRNRRRGANTENGVDEATMKMMAKTTMKSARMLTATLLKRQKLPPMMKAAMMKISRNAAVVEDDAVAVIAVAARAAADDAENGDNREGGSPLTLKPKTKRQSPQKSLLKCREAMMMVRKMPRKKQRMMHQMR